MLTIIYPIIPILIATIFILQKHNKSKSLLFGICIGILQYILQNGCSINNVLKIINTIISIVVDNITIMLSIFLLLILVNLIRNSKIIDILNVACIQYITSPLKLIILLIIFGIIFCLDDYLSCVATAAIITAIANKHGFSNEKTAYLINITAVSCCCLSPFSSWMPVIKSSLIDSGISESAIYQIIPFNYNAILGIIFVFMVGLYKPYAFHSKPNNSIKSMCVSEFMDKDHSKRKLKSPEIFIFCTIFIILLGSFTLFTFIFPSSNAMIKSSIISIFSTILISKKTKMMNMNQIIISIKQAYSSTLELCMFLIPIWTLAKICNTLLCLKEEITIWILAVQIPYVFLPVIIYCLAGIFSLLVGSAYGTFGLFIPIAIQISNSINIGCIQVVTIAAAISGGLQAANSFASDTMELSAKETESNLYILQRMQLPYGIIQFSFCAVAFLIAGVLTIYETIFTVIMPLLIMIILLLFYFILCPYFIKNYNPKYLKYLNNWQFYNISFTNSVYYKEKNTFHSKYIDIEYLLRIIQAMILKKLILLPSICFYYRKLLNLKS